MLTDMCIMCRPGSCIRLSSTPTNDKKADGHDWRHRSTPGDSRPSRQSRLLCTSTWQEEPIVEPEERIAARKCLYSPVIHCSTSILTINLCLRTATGSYMLMTSVSSPNIVPFNMFNIQYSWLLAKCPRTYYLSNHLKPNPT